MEAVLQWEQIQLESRWDSRQNQPKLAWLHTSNLQEVYQDTATLKLILMVPLIKELRPNCLMVKHMLHELTMR